MASHRLGPHTALVCDLQQMVGYRRLDKFDLHHDMGTYNADTGAIEAVSPRRLITFFVVRGCLLHLGADRRKDETD